MVKTIDSQWLKNGLLDMQRWENEDGQMIENNAPLRLSFQPVPLSPGSHDRSLQWNERFVIEPFQPSNGIFLIRKKYTTKIGWP